MATLNDNLTEHVELIEAACALAARISLDRTRGAADVDELWRIIRMARNIGG
jgi:hypothetical protein